MTERHPSRSHPPLPSKRWASFNGWEYNGLKQRLESLLDRLDKNALVRHAQLITGQECVMSEPFSAGQFWICFEIVALDGSLVIARVRLPPHPETLLPLSEHDELDYSVACEMATMRYVRQKLPGIAVPKVYAFADSGSQHGKLAGAAYMLLEGFYGNTLHDVVPDMCDLPTSSQKHIMAQWAMAQAQFATMELPQIGSICAVTDSGEPVIDKLSHGAAMGISGRGPFPNAVEYFTAIGEAILRKADRNTDDGSSFFVKLGALAFIDIVKSTRLFNAASSGYPLNHMDLGTQNILVDDEYNFVAIIDWEFAQAAPWSVNHFPMPFTILCPEEKIKSVLDDPANPAYKYVSKHASARSLYVQALLDAERSLSEQGNPLRGSIALAVESPASRIFARLNRLQGDPEEDKAQVLEIVRLGFEFVDEEADRYLMTLERKLEQSKSSQSDGSMGLLE